MPEPTGDPAALQQFVLDPWSPLSHKRAIGDTDVRRGGWLAPTWVGEHHRRLTAYELYWSYMNNVARHWLSTQDPDIRRDHREYGDAAVMVEQIVSAVLGDRQELIIPQAAGFNPDLGDGSPKGSGGAQKPPEATDETSGSDAPSEKGPTPEELAENAEAGRALERQDWLREWAEADDFLGKVEYNENRAVGLGDAVYVLSWDYDANRVCIEVLDPGMYFPVLSDTSRYEEPRTTHLAWEIERDEDGIDTVIRPGQYAHASGSKTQRFVHRVTYELVEVERSTNLPWQGADEKPSRWTCLWTEGLWRLGNSASSIDFGKKPDEYVTTRDENGDEIEIDHLDLGIDFSPVQHLPNFTSYEQHYGQSSLATIAHILDDLQYADTDLSAASATTGAPPIWTSGAGVSSRTERSYGPGQRYKLDVGGAMHVLDTSRSLDALIKYVKELLARMSTNARVPESVLGRVGGGGAHVPSGVALALSFGPLSSLVSKMRLTRKRVYTELLGKVQKMSMVQGALKPGLPFEAELSFGSYLPVDKGTVGTLVQALMTAKAISLETALQMLIDAGFPIEDVNQEVDRIQERDFEGAVALLDAVGQDEPVYRYLGLEDLLAKKQAQDKERAAAQAKLGPPQPGLPNGPRFGAVPKPQPGGQEPPKP